MNMAQNKEESNDQLVGTIQTYMRNKRDMARRNIGGQTALRSSPIKVETRIDSHNGQSCSRLVLFLQGSGCNWAKTTGGCTFCGFWNATNFGARLSDHQYIKQVESAMTNFLESFDASQDLPLVLALYNDGSLLDEREISSNALMSILSLISKLSFIKEIVLESKIADLSKDRLTRIQELLPNKKIRIAFGFESANPAVRKYCVNKDFSNDTFEEKMTLLNTLGMKATPLIFVKPPFLTESQSIDDILASLLYLEKFGCQRIDLEAATVQVSTLLYDFWYKGLYRPPWLWSIVEILRRKIDLGLQTPVYVSPSYYTPECLDYSRNCPSCDPLFQKLFAQYNRSGDFKIFEEIKCPCHVEWQNHLSINSSLSTENIKQQAQSNIRRLFDSHFLSDDRVGLGAL